MTTTHREPPFTCPLPNSACRKLATRRAIRILSVIAAAPLCGCSLDAEAIAELLHTQTAVLIGVQSGLESIESEVTNPPALLHAAGDGLYLYDGSLSGNGAWDDGVVTVRGYGSVANAGTSFNVWFDLEYLGVRRDDIVLNGHTTNYHRAEIVAGEISLAFAMEGSVDVSGDVQGHANLDYTVTLAAENSGQPAYSGTVNQRELR